MAIRVHSLFGELGLVNPLEQKQIGHQKVTTTATTNCVTGGREQTKWSARVAMVDARSRTEHRCTTISPVHTAGRC